MIETRLLRPGDEALALEVFSLMRRVFGDQEAQLPTAYATQLLSSAQFLCVAGSIDGRLCGGATGHLLPVTRVEETELFIYDLAVTEPERRKGVGRAIVNAMIDEARARGAMVAFVPADNDDEHALRFYERLGGVGAPVTIFTFEH